MAKTDLTAHRLRELLNYDPETGIFTWLVDRPSFRGKAKAGTVAGNASGNGYWQIGIDGGAYSAHRLAWFYMHGEWPKLIDHINRCKTDNRSVNLRSATYIQNGINSKARDPASGAKGVEILPSGRWRARIKNNYKFVHIGCYDTKAEAIEAYESMAAKIFKHETSLLPAGNPC